MNLNLIANLPTSLAAEAITPLVQSATVRIERIVSTGQASAPDFWYEQEEDEWVAVLTGEGTVEFADGRTVRLGSGDWLNLPAGCRHRVAATSPAEPTVWLAVFYRAGECG